MALNGRELKRDGKLNLIHTVNKFSQSTGHQFSDSATCENVEAQISPSLTSLAEDSLARILAMPESGQGLMESAVGCGASMHESFASYDRTTSSWRTSQLCLDGEWGEFSETWPRSGMMRNGAAYQHRMLERHISENESGLLPTPKASEWKGGYSSTGSDSLGRMATKGTWPTPRSSEIAAAASMKTISKIADPKRNLEEAVWEAEGKPTTGFLNPMWVEWLMGYPLEWTALEVLAMPSSRKSQNGLVKGSWKMDDFLNKQLCAGKSIDEALAEWKKL